MSKMNIAIIPSNIFSIRIKEELEKKNLDVKIISTSIKDFNFKKKIQNYSIIHYVGSPTVSIIGIISLIRFRLWGKKIVVSWIGFDVRRASQKFYWKILTLIFKNLIHINITEDENAVNLLKKASVFATIQSPPLYLIFSLHPLPKNKKIAVYLPDKLEDDFNFYQGNLIKKLVEDFPNLQFIIIANSGRHFIKNKNVQSIKWTNNMKKIYEDVISVIRLPKKDTTGSTIIETLSMGRTMLASATNFPFCNVVKNYDDLRNHLVKIIENPVLNKKGSDYVHQNYNNDVLAEQLIKIYRDLEVT